MNIVNNRYVLKNQLFADSHIGELHQVRDLKIDRNNAPTDFLLHILPGKIFSYPVFKQTCTDLKALQTPELSIPVLPVLDCGWTGEEAFFVIQAPDTWAYSSLPPIKNSLATTPHQRATTIVKELAGKELTGNKLSPSFFIITPEGDLHLLGTALSPTIIQQQDESGALLEAKKSYQGKTTSKNSGYRWSWAALILGSIGVAGATGAYIFLGAASKNNEVLEPFVPETAVLETKAEDKPTQLSALPRPEPEPLNINWNGMSEARLIQRVKSAFQKNRIQTALYFARILWRNGSRHKDLVELLEGIIQHYQQQADTMSSNGNTEQAKSASRQARLLIKEFGLDR